ncbi:hypothetical protein ACT80S_18345 [Ramlibacter sp. MAHUQ-53]|uniref:hypothetical protein n=1 Tax=unclassified Ramlibacter TaxID=2617605 RepID=UPI00363F32B9
MTIWIVRKHPPYPFDARYATEAFTIHSTHPTRAAAQVEAHRKMQCKPKYFYSVGRVQLREAKQ